jgi:nucleotide-binding universal stress UspA family protein
MFSTITVPLDGSPFAEQALPWALSLARRAEARLDLVRVHVLYALQEPVRLTGGRCNLLRVVELPGPGQPAGSVEAREAQAWEYLEHVSVRLRDQGLEPGIRVAVAAQAAEAILEEADAQGSELIALATHGRGGFRRMLLGSVADQVIWGCSLPVLVCPPAG